MNTVAWQSSSAGLHTRGGIAQRLWMSKTSPIMTIDSLRFASSASDDEDDRASHSTNVGDSSGASTDRWSSSQSGSERSSPIAAAAFPLSGGGFDSLSTSSHI